MMPQIFRFNNFIGNTDYSMNPLEIQVFKKICMAYIDNTEPWMIYHAMSDPNAGWEGRTARVEKFGWNPDNSPAFPRPSRLGTELQAPSGE